MSAPFQDVLTLQNEALCLTICPHLGGAIQSMRYFGPQARLSSGGAIELLKAPPPIIQTVRDLGSFPLVPFSNRIEQAQLVWDKTLFMLEKMGTSEPHAIHGVAWQRPWQVQKQMQKQAQNITYQTGDCLQTATLSYHHTGDAAWPFAFDVVQTFALEPSALRLSLVATNRTKHPAPMGLGWHPYFAKRADMSLAFSASSRWEMNADQLPTHQTPSNGISSGVHTLQSDHCFEGWGRRAILQDPSIRLEISSSLPRLVVFTRPELGFIAIEPVSHVNNALRLAANQPAYLQQLGVRLLESGAQMCAHMRIAVI